MKQIFLVLMLATSVGAFAKTLRYPSLTMDASINLHDYSEPANFPFLKSGIKDRSKLLRLWHEGSQGLHLRAEVIPASHHSLIPIIQAIHFTEKPVTGMAAWTALESALKPLTESDPENVRAVAMATKELAIHFMPQLMIGYKDYAREDDYKLEQEIEIALLKMNYYFEHKLGPEPTPSERPLIAQTERPAKPIVRAKKPAMQSERRAVTQNERPAKPPVARPKNPDTDTGAKPKFVKEGTSPSPGDNSTLIQPFFKPTSAQR